MSLDLKTGEDQPVTSLSELESYFREAEKPADALRLGLEHEKLVYPRGGATPVPYEGPAGIRALLEKLTAAGWEPFRESPSAPPIALTRGEATVSFEPGGQLELSGTPVTTARAAHEENLRHLAEVKAAAEPSGLSLVTLGYRPFDSVEAMPWMPKSRYRAMRQTLGARGRYALNMMLMTATGQVSLDWTDEADCARKVTLASRLTPLWVALYANSPLVEGRPSGFMSFRSEVWTGVDPSRCGYVPAVFDGSFSYRAYVEWALDAPLLFLRRQGAYLTPPITFRELLARGYQGTVATRSDWVDHLSTLFPEVRIKRVMEVRGADGVNPALTGALAALLRGIFYDRAAMDEAEQLLPALRRDEHLAFHAAARRGGLSQRWKSARLAELALELLAIARRGLLRLDALDAPLLDPLEELARQGRSPAEEVLAAWAAAPRPAELLQRFTIG
ncbi:MAG: glutamate--cysteine ligase [Myxococcota bacterium]